MRVRVRVNQMKENRSTYLLTKRQINLLISRERKQIDLSFNEKTNQSANLNFCFSAIDCIVERGEYVK